MSTSAPEKHLILRAGRVYLDVKSRSWRVLRITNAGKDRVTDAYLPSMALAECIDASSQTRHPQWFMTEGGRWCLESQSIYACSDCDLMRTAP